MSSAGTSISHLTDQQRNVLNRLRDMPDSEINYDDASELPSRPQSPAATLRKRMNLREMGQKEMAEALHVPVSRLVPVLSFQCSGMTADMAARLAHYFGDTPQFWMNLQNEYDLAHVDQEAIAREVLPAES